MPFNRLTLWQRDLAASLMGKAQPELNGLRGLAVLIVIASHTNAIGLAGQGGIGVWLFFVLSGYLLASPFLENTNLATSLRGLARFYKRRLLRILPAYWTAIVVFYSLAASSPTRYAILNMSMITSDGHLWSVKQELVLYLLLPALLMPLAFVKNLFLLASLIVSVGIFIHAVVDQSVLTLTGNGRQLPVFAFPFIAGIAAAVLQRTEVFDRMRKHRSASLVCDAITLICVTVLFLSARAYLAVLLPRLGWHDDGLYWGWNYYVAYGTGSAVLLLAVVTRRGKLTNALFGYRPLMACGIVGYSLYLIHPFSIAQLNRWGLEAGVAQFAACIVLSFLLSTILYGYVERVFWSPGFQVNPKTARNDGRSGRNL